ncbi:MAG: 2-amino-4-hydroxy-6-hydroxymethyldihydropteridine diphosphokinase, partial [Chloroflexi bacterium]|nr:2-amino-4-hydroxy-6-hydroxymethyldihydropteridine diphosphokinase [Chloroflexota bacterium]
DLGRRPDGAPSERWGPRPIDIDVLLYGESVIDEAGLRVPHAELANRAFVLVPLAELAAGLRHPELGRTIGELADATDRSGVQKRAASGWEQGEAQGVG